MRWSAGAILAAVVALSGCMSLIHGRRQDVVVAAPAATEVVVDGVPVGTGPQYLRLLRSESHTVRLRDHGQEDRVEIIRSKIDWPMFLLAELGPPVAWGLLTGSMGREAGESYLGSAGIQIVGMSILYTIPSLVVDSLTGATSRLEPSSVPDAESPAAPASWHRKTLAILDFDAIGVPASDAAVVTDLVRERFIGGGTFIIVEREHMKKILSEQAFQQTGTTSDASAVTLGRLLNAQLVVLGSFGKVSTEYYLIIRMVNVETGASVFSGTIHGKSIEELDANSGNLQANIRRQFRK